VEGERKQVTVMFVDIVRSMELADAVGPESWVQVLERFFALSAEAVHGFEGTIDKFTGDGVMALFGAPVAYEDHAHRACSAALELLTAVSALTGELVDDGLPLALRVGLNSGEVIVGNIGGDLQMTYTAIGQTVGLARRMESLAPPGSAVVSAATARLIEDEFDLQDLGLFEVKGSDVPQPVFELVRRGTGRSPLETAGARGRLSTFVGREAELAALEEALERARAGDGQVVGLVGDAGVGKSRLAHELAQHCAGLGIVVQRGRAVAHGRETPLLPVLDLMRASLGVGEIDDSSIARQHITSQLTALDSALEDDLPLLLEFLGLRDPERPAPRIDPEARQRRLLALIGHWVRARSRVEPWLILIEDLHWLDEASGVFLAELVRATANSRTLLVLTYRPEYGGVGLRASHCRQIIVPRLDNSTTERLAISLLGDHPSLDGLWSLVVERAAGNPFFVEELVQALRETGHLVGDAGAHRLTRTLEDVVLPATVQATLAARIDRLAPNEKTLLQDAAVIGQEVPELLLRESSLMGSEEMLQSIEGLVAAELLIEGTSGDGNEYAFKHPLTQEVAYRCQLRARRQDAHARVGRALQALHPDDLDELAALLAHHARAAGQMTEAATWHLRAATWAGLTSAAEAEHHWRTAAEIAHTLPDSAERVGLAVGSRLGILAQTWRTRIAWEEVDRLHLELEALLEGRPEFELLRFFAGYAYCANLSVGGRTGEAHKLLRELLASPVLTEQADPALPVAVKAGAAWVELISGHPREAVAMTDEGLLLAGQDTSVGRNLGVIEHPYAALLDFGGLARGLLGDLAGALGMLERCIVIARSEDAPEIEGYALWARAFLRGEMGDSQGALADGKALLDVAHRSGNSNNLAGVESALHAGHLAANDWVAAEESARRGLAVIRDSTVMCHHEPHLHAGLAEAMVAQGRPEEGIESARRAVATAEQYVLPWAEPRARITLADALMAARGNDAVEETQHLLGGAAHVAQRTGITLYEPRLEAARRRVQLLDVGRA